MFRAPCPHLLSCEGLDATSRTQAHEGRGLRKRIRGLRVCSTQINNCKEEKEKDVMSTATVPLSSGALPDLLGPPGLAMSDLLDAAPLAGLDLPCRSGDTPDLCFADTPADLERAKLLCLDCPVRSECLAGAAA